MKKINRNVLAVLAILVMLFSGLVNAWSVLSRPIAAQYPQWNAGQMSLTYTITMFCFCLGGMSGGWLQKKCSVRFALWLSAAMYAAGFFLTASMQGRAALYLGFGLLAGLASGLSYNVVLTSVSSWFPEKTGTISGILLMGFGIGSFLIGKIYAAVTPVDGSGAWRGTFRIFALILLVMLVFAGIFVRRPREEEIREEAAKAGKPVVKHYYEDVTTGEMVKRASFWLFLLWTIVMSAVGVTVISQASSIVLEASPGLTQGTVATIVGIQAIFNGLGRILYGALFDRFGRRACMAIDGLMYAAGLFLLLAAVRTQTMWLLIPGFVLGGLANGGVPTTIAGFAHLFYGAKNYPTNFSIVNTNLLVSSFAGTLAGVIYDARGSYAATILLAIGYLAAGLVINFVIREPKGTAAHTEK